MAEMTWVILVHRGRFGKIKRKWVSGIAKVRTQIHCFSVTLKGNK